MSEQGGGGSPGFLASMARRAGNVSNTVALALVRAFGSDQAAAGQAAAPARIGSERAAEALRAGPAMPSPWTFLASGFSIVLVLLSFAINRIHALVPPRRPTGRRVQTNIRVALRLPSLAGLAVAIACLLVHSGRVACSGEGLVIGWIGKARDERDILWLTFLAVSLAVLTETFVRALDDELSTTQGFNLLSFAFLMHIHSHPSPSPIVGPPDTLHSHLLLVLAELLTLHTSFTFSPPVPLLRLPITFLFSVAGQIFVVHGVRTAFLAALDSPAAGGAAMDGTIWLSRAPEMMFEIISLMSIVLRFLSVVLRREELTWEGTFGHPSFYPDVNDDYTIAIIKYGTSTLESTRLTGLSNEVDPILRASLNRISAALPLLLDAEDGAATGQRVVLSRGRSADLVGVETGLGLKNEIRQVDARERERPLDPMARHPDRFWEVVKAGKIVAKWGVWAAWRGWLLARRLRGAKKRDEDAMQDGWRAWGPGEKEDAEDSDFEPDSDSDGSSSSESEDDGEDRARERDETPPTTLFHDLSHAATPPHSQDASSSLVPFNEGDETEDLTPILLAHHLRPPASSPLTRRRYRALARAGTADEQEDFLNAVVMRRQEVEWRAVGEGDEDDGVGRGRLCVVCLGEERCVILWPCRCLSICEDCRSNLADRTPASGQLCPTCRTPVKGFSRIFIP